jgi:catechol 2,3-dioxygenase-like lactoylglutathione lyase family enzyme
MIMSLNQSAKLWGHLHYLQFGSPQPAKLAQFAYDAIQMTVHRDGDHWICDAPGRLLVYSPGQPKTLLSAGYAVDDPAILEALKGRLAMHEVSLEAAPLPFFEDDSVTFRDPDGNCMSFGRPRAMRPAAEGLPARLQHVVVASTDAERMTRFYTEVVGFRLSDRVLDDEGGLRTSFMRTDREHHSLAVFKADTCRLDHHCYETTNWNLLRDWADHFSEAGLTLQWGPGRHGPGNNLFIFVHDPDDNWLEISAELEIVDEHRSVGVWPQAERTLNLWGKGHLRS